MWKLIWKDSLHINKSNVFTKIYFPIYYYFLYMNFIFTLENVSVFHYISVISLMAITISLGLFPIKLAKGLYLCPLTEKDRKKYLKLSCLLRFVTLMTLLALILLVFSFFIDYDSLLLVYQYIFSVLFTLSTILMFVSDNNSGIQNLQTANKTKVKADNNHVKNASSFLLISIMILSTLGVCLPVFFKSNDHGLNFIKCLYNIPSIIICLIFFVIYFVKYFDKILSIKANCEVFTYSPNKKAGVFNAD